MRKLIPVFLIAVVFASCKDKKTIEYNVECASCYVSYWNENNDFISQIETQGDWNYSYEITVDPNEEEQVIKVSAQSRLCEDADACKDSTLLAADVVYVNITIDGTIVEADTVSNKKFATAFVETNL